MSSSRGSIGTDFKILGRLGSGSFGTVFKVLRYADEKEYVIKEIRIADLSGKEQLSAVNEVKLLAKIKSPFVVKYYDYYIDKESLHIVMEFCNEGDLSKLIKRAKSKGNNTEWPGLRYEIIWSMVLQIMLGLNYLHSENILHRDLKSANVFLNSKNNMFQVKIGDLGVAKLLDTSTAFAQTIVGTPYYLSPELCADLPYRDKSDCWALGVILYECCCLKHPFDARNQCALIMKIIQSPVPPLPKQIPSELIRLTMWLLSKDPNSRPSIKDVLNERIIRDKLEEYQFTIPENLAYSEPTTKLTPNIQQTTLKKSMMSTIPRPMPAQTPAVPTPTPTPVIQKTSQPMQGNRVRGGGPHARRSPSAKALQRNQVDRHSAQSEDKAHQEEHSRDEHKSTAQQMNDHHDEEEGKGGGGGDNDHNGGKSRNHVVTTRIFQEVYPDDPPPYTAKKEGGSSYDVGDSDDQLYDEDFEEEHDDEDEESEVNGEFTVNSSLNYEDSLSDDGVGLHEGAPVSWMIKDEAGNMQVGEKGEEMSPLSRYNEGASDDEKSTGSGSGHEGEEDRQSTQFQEGDLTVIEQLIRDTRSRCVDSLGESLFNRLYGLCAAHVSRPLHAQSEQTRRGNEQVVKELGDVLQEQLLAGAEVAVDSVKKVKVLLAMESELRKMKEAADK